MNHLIIQHPLYLGCFLDLIFFFFLKQHIVWWTLINLQSANVPSCALISKTPSKTQLQSSPVSHRFSPLNSGSPPGFVGKHPPERVRTTDELQYLWVKKKKTKGHAGKLIHFRGMYCLSKKHKINVQNKKHTAPAYPPLFTPALCLKKQKKTKKTSPGATRKLLAPKSILI